MSMYARHTWGSEGGPRDAAGWMSERIRDAEFAWLRDCEAAWACCLDGHWRAAAAAWEAAAPMAERFPAADPRRAAGASNLSLARRIRGAEGEALRLNQAAAECWREAETWLERARLTPRGRSSLFHLRLWRRHAAHYERAARADCLAALRTAQAVTFVNHAELLNARGDRRGAREACGAAREVCAAGHAPGASDSRWVATPRRRMELRRALLEGEAPDQAEERAEAPEPGGRKPPGGRQPPPAAQQPRDAEARAPFSSHAREQRWLVDEPPEFSVEGRVMAALLLTRLAPVHFPAWASSS